MHVMDIVFLVFIFVLAVKGLIRGLVKEVFGLVGLVLAVVLAINVNVPLGEIVAKYGRVNVTVGEILVFALVFFAVYMIIFGVGIMFSRFLDKIELGFLNRSLGFVVGIVKGAFVIVIFAFFVHNLPFLRGTEGVLRKSSLIYSYADYIVSNKRITSAIDKQLRRLGR